MLEQRKAFRRERKFGEADRIRDRLVERGIVIKDRPDGSVDWARATSSHGNGDRLPMTAAGVGSTASARTLVERCDSLDADRRYQALSGHAVAVARETMPLHPDLLGATPRRRCAVSACGAAWRSPSGASGAAIRGAARVTILYRKSPHPNTRAKTKHGPRIARHPLLPGDPLAARDPVRARARASSTSGSPRAASRIATTRSSRSRSSRRS